MTLHYVQGVIAKCRTEPAEKDGKRVAVLEYYKGTGTGTEEHDISVSIKRDGSVSLSEERGEGFIYLYPEQVKMLKKLLKVREA